MKLCLLVLTAAAAFAQTKNVYLLPMPGGLDQYLAMRLTQEKVLQVVTDPAKADVIITDRIGGDFEQTLKDLYKETEPAATTSGDTFAKPNMRPLSTARGSVFLVDRASGNVLWSTFEQPKNSNANELSKAARRIVDRMAEEMQLPK